MQELVNDFEKKSNESNSDWSDIQELFGILHSNLRNSNAAEWRDMLDGVLDTDEFLKWLAVNYPIRVIVKQKIDHFT